MGAQPLESLQPAKPEASPSASAVLQDFVYQHLKSTGRNNADVRTDNQAIANDQGGNTTAHRIIKLDHQMQQDLAQGRPISAAEMAASEQLHAKSKGFTKVDAKMDRDAIGQDPTDANGERAAIKSDQKALKLHGLSPKLRAAVQTDLTQKRALLANETGDTSDESRYLRHDQTADRTGDRLATAIRSHNPADIKAALKADVAAQGAKGTDYRQDTASERGYISADDLNTRQNALIAQALKTDPYAHLTRHGR